MLRSSRGFGRLCLIRPYSVYGPALSWAEPAADSAASAASSLPEIVEADRLVQSRSHLQSNNALSYLDRALQIAQHVPAGAPLVESLLARVAFIHQQRGDYAAEAATIAAVLNLSPARAGLWNGAAAIAKYRCDEEPVVLDHGSDRDVAIDGVLRRSSATITEAIDNVESKRTSSALGVLNLINGWILSETDRASDAIPYLRASTEQVSSSGDKTLRASVLLPGRIFLAQCLGLDRAESRTILEESLRLCDELELPESNVLRTDTMRLLAECYSRTGEAIVAEGLFRSSLSGLSRLPFLSVPELTALARLRTSYADLLRRMEWNGVKRTRDAQRILSEGDADSGRCPFRTRSCSEKVPDWVVQVLVAD